jgi:hypothetical protein
MTSVQRFTNLGQSREYWKGSHVAEKYEACENEQGGVTLEAHLDSPVSEDYMKQSNAAISRAGSPTQTSDTRV